ncbi:MAG TPA: HAD-IA family hydrolase [Patescibacteria group bacterium]|nr:HAD-IA family hydrolase [Patescibacteria group bacterium]
MIKAIIFDFSRVLLNARDKKYTDSLNALYKKLSQSENFTSLEHFEFNQKLLDFATGLKEKIGLYIFTTGAIQEDIYFKPILAGIFKWIFTVEEVGFPKNNSEAYKVIAKKLSLEPEEILFIDDTEENVTAASEASLKTVHFVSTDQVINDIRSSLRGLV